MKTKKLWKVLLIIMLTFTAPLSFSSCRDDFNEKALIAELARTDNGCWSCEFKDGEWQGSITIVFYYDKTGVIKEFAIAGKAPEIKIKDERYEFTYFLDDEKIHFVMSDGKRMDVNYSLSDKSLLLSADGEDFLFSWVLMI